LTEQKFKNTSYFPEREYSNSGKIGKGLPLDPTLFKFIDDALNLNYDEVMTHIRQCADRKKQVGSQQNFQNRKVA
jgi:hypothetical protein